MFPKTPAACHILHAMTQQTDEIVETYLPFLVMLYSQSASFQKICVYISQVIVNHARGAETRPL